MMVQRCPYCHANVDVAEATTPSQVAELLIAHLRLVCTQAPGARELADDARFAEATASAELAGTDDVTSFFQRWDIVSLGGTVLQTHHERLCRPPCVIHSPSEHHMREWPSVWAQSFNAVLRVCPHEHYHPDPDDLQARTGQLQHTCDGCCLPPRGGEESAR